MPAQPAADKLEDHVLPSANRTVETVSPDREQGLVRAREEQR